MAAIDNNEKSNIVGGYEFLSETDADKANMDLSKIKLLESRVKVSRPKDMLAVYQKAIENKIFKDSKNKQAYPYGASINVDGIDACFSGIDTNGVWKTYTIYIKSTSSNNVNIELSLGSENALTKGTAYYSSIEVKKIEQDDYLKGIKVLETENVDNVLAIGNTDKQEETNNPSNDNNSIQFDWLLVPSLVFGIVILFAVCAVIVRNIKRKSHKKIKVHLP